METFVSPDDQSHRADYCTLRAKLKKNDENVAFETFFTVHREYFAVHCCVQQLSVLQYCLCSVLSVIQ